MGFAGNWYRFEQAPAGSYACIWAPDGKLQGASLSWMPAARGQVPPHARRGLIMPIPNPEGPALTGEAQ